MDWTTAQVSYTEQNNTFAVAKPATVMEFYTQGQELAPYGERLFDRLLSLFPTSDVLYKLGKTDREYHAQTLKQARPASLAFWQGFREHGSGAYEGT